MRDFAKPFCGAALIAALALGLQQPAAAFPKKMDVDKKVEKLTEKLGLNEQQAEQLRTIYENQQRAFETQKELTQQQINAVLTPAQQDQYKKMKEEWKAKAEDRMKHKHEGMKEDAAETDTGAEE